MDCASEQRALIACKEKLGLLPRQCYKVGLDTCDAEEFGLKKCYAFLHDPRSAAILYDPMSDRDSRFAANKRLQKKLQRVHQPCQP